MNLVASFAFAINYIISIGVGTIITRYIAKNYERDTSYKIAFYVTFIWMTIIFTILFIIRHLTGNLSFTEGQNLVSISIYLIILTISLSSYLIIGPFIIKRLYETEFRESFSMAIRVLIYIGVIQLLFFTIHFL